MAVGFRSVVRTGMQNVAGVPAITQNINDSYNPIWDGVNKPPSLEGTKYNRYGERGPGIGSILDSNIIERRIKEEKDNLGAGYVQLQVVDPSQQNKPLNIGGRMHYADSTGKFTIIDEKYIEIMKQREMERREYIEGLIQTAILSDEICASLLGTTEGGLAAILGPNTGIQYGVPQTINGQANPVYQVDARPSAIETYSESSQAYSNAVQKFKMCLKAKMPIVSELTPAKALNAD